LKENITNVEQLRKRKGKIKKLFSHLLPSFVSITPDPGTFSQKKTI